VDLVFAYVDPGSGSLIIQAVIAGLVAGPILLRNKIAQGARAVRRAIGREPERPASTVHDSTSRR
jgi:hypothetical protein